MNIARTQKNTENVSSSFLFRSYTINKSSCDFLRNAFAQPIALQLTKEPKKNEADNQARNLNDFPILIERKIL